MQLIIIISCIMFMHTGVQRKRVSKADGRLVREQGRGIFPARLINTDDGGFYETL